MDFAIANSGWSIAITGTWPGLRCWTETLITFIECLIIATECAFSRNRGKRAIVLVGLIMGSSNEAWYAAHVV